MSNVFVTVCTPAARNVVRGVFRAHRPTVGLTSHEIYESALKLYPDARTDKPLPTFGHIPEEDRNKLWKLPPQPENPKHPIRSMRYLKKVVLEHMAENKELAKASLRRHQHKDEHGNPLITMRCLEESTTIPYEQRHPDLDREKVVWVWKHVKPELLEKDEPVASTDTRQLHLSHDLNEDPDFGGAKIRFINQAIPQEPQATKPKGFGVRRGRGSDS